MKNKGFTLVELLAVIAILAILVIIALPNVLKMYNNAKKNSFLTEAKTLAQDVSSKYITESMKGNKLTTISNKQNSLDLSGRNIEYNFDLDEKGKIKRMMVYDGTYCVVTTKDYTNLKTSDVSESCSYDELHNIAGTLSKNFYEMSGNTDKALVNSITFYSDGRTINGAESYDVSEKGDNSIIMYIKPVSDSSTLLDLTVVANGTIALPEDSSELFSFSGSVPSALISNLSSISFNDSIDTSKVTDMSYMFSKSGCSTSKLSECYNSTLSTIDVSCFNTSSVTNMRGMFFVVGISNLIGLNSFDTSKVTDMSNMFVSPNLITLDVGHFDTSNVTNMSSMFSSIKIDKLDLSNFDTSKVTDMSYMFQYSKLKTLDLSNFDISKVDNMNSMFSGAKTTTGYARTQADADKFNNSSNKPSALTFTVK